MKESQSSSFPPPQKKKNLPSNVTKKIWKISETKNFLESRSVSVKNLKSFIGTVALDHVTVMRLVAQEHEERLICNVYRDIFGAPGRSTENIQCSLDDDNDETRKILNFCFIKIKMRTFKSTGGRSRQSNFFVCCFRLDFNPTD